MARKQQLTIADYIGRPYRAGARGPDEFDCWGLVHHVLEHCHGIIVADYERPEQISAGDALRLFRDHAPDSGFVQTILPRAGDVALIGAKFGGHCGICEMDGNIPGMLHALESSGVMFEPFAAIGGRGLKILAWYRHS